MTSIIAAAPSRPTIIPVLSLLAAMVSIQYGATLAEGLFPIVGAQGATSLRLIIGAAILAVIRRPWRTRIARRAWPPLLGYAAALAAMNLLFYQSIKTIPLGVAVALEFSGPLMVSAVSSRRTRDVFWVALAAAGCVMMSPLIGPRHALDPAGVGFGLGAGACWAVYIVFGQRAGRAIGGQATALGLAVAALLAAPLGLPHFGPALLQLPVAVTALAVGVFSSALPFSLEMVALTRLPTRAYGMMTSLEPVVGAALGLALLHQMLSGVQWVGVLAVIAAAAGSATTSKAAALSPE